MSDQPAPEAVISLDRDGRYLDANAEALDMLGVSIDELRTSAPDRFAIRPSVDAEQAALRSEWESGGTQPLVGTTGVRRADGTTIRVAYAIERMPGTPEWARTLDEIELLRGQYQEIFGALKPASGDVD